MNKQVCNAVLQLAFCLLFGPRIPLAGPEHTLGPAEGSFRSGTSLTEPVRTTERNYTLTARVRPLLFWITREGVGSARIAWTEEDAGLGSLELLIGSDPSRAPRRINRWGYVRERLVGPCFETLGVMTESSEQSIKEAELRLGAPDSRQRFKAIRSRLCRGEARSTIMDLGVKEELTLYDLDRVLEQLPSGGSPTRNRTVPEETDPGLLFAAKRMLHDSVVRFHQLGRGQTLQGHRCVFVHNAALYELVLHSSRVVEYAVSGGDLHVTAIESRFETRAPGGKKTSSFTIIYATEPPLAETPLRIVYRPRWWFEVELQLVQEAPVEFVASGREPWTPGEN